MNLIGTFEGWVPTTTDLYLRGNNAAGFTALEPSSANNVVSFETGQLRLETPNGGSITYGAIASANLTGLSRVNIQGSLYLRNSHSSTSSIIYIEVRTSKTDYSGSASAKLSGSYDVGSTFTLSVDVSAIDAVRWIRVYTGTGWGAYIYRIWLS